MFLERMTMTHWLQRKRNQSIPALGLDAALGFATGALCDLSHMRSMVLEYAHQHLAEKNHPVL